MRRADVGTSIFLLVLTCAYLVVARRYEGGAGTVPTVVGGVTLVVLVVQLLAPRVAMLLPLLGTVDLSDGEELLADRAVRRRLLTISLSLLLIPVLIVLVGIVVAVPLYVAFALSIIGRQPLLVVAGCTVGIAAVVYVLLVVLVSFPVDNGWLWQML
jgi:hypothetical protein